MNTTSIEFKPARTMSISDYKKLTKEEKNKIIHTLSKISDDIEEHYNSMLDKFEEDNSFFILVDF